MVDRGPMRLDIRPRYVSMYQADVDEVLAKLRAGVPVSHLAKEYRVSSNTINNIGWGRYGDPPVWKRNLVGRRVLA